MLTDRYLQGSDPQDSRKSQGRFLKPEMLTPELLAQLQELNAKALEKEQSLAEMALRWILEQQGVTSVLVGASSVEQLKKNIKAGCE